jgi:hypothetical protein
LTNGDVRAIVLNPDVPNTIYAGTGSGIFRSANGGDRWSEVNDGLYNTEISALAITSRYPNPSTVYVGVWGDVFVADFWDISSFEITITSPNGSENWYVGETHNVTWISENTSGNVRIVYSTNGGLSWRLVIPDTPDDGSYLWTVPNTSSINCLVKICDKENIDCCDESDNTFTISPPCQLTVNSPNWGESWCVNEVHSITWSSESTSSHVKIEYSSNNGLNWQTVIQNTPADGSFSWTIPNIPSLNCLIKVCDAENDTCCDVSDQVFKISACGPLEILTESIPDGMKGCSYIETITVTGGILPYTWSVISGSMPGGLELDNDTGTISGSPDSVGTFCLTVEVTDDEGGADQQEYCLTIEGYVGVKADPTCDGAVDILDALMTINFVLEIIMPSPEQTWAADCSGPPGNCDGDGSVDVLDALKIVNVILGLDACP